MGIVRVSNSGVFVVESGVVSTAGTPPPQALPQQGNIQLRWDMSISDDVWLNSVKSIVVQDGDPIFKIGVKGQGPGGGDINTDYNQPSEVSRPIWRETGINGLGAAEWDGSNDFMTCNPDPNGMTSGDQTVFCVFTSDDDSGFDVVFNWGGGAQSWNPSLVLNAGLIRPGMNGNFGDVGASSTFPIETTLGVIMTDDGSDAQEARYSHDANVDTSTTTTTGTLEGSLFPLGSQSSGGGTFAGKIGEVIAWAPSLTSSEMDELQIWAFEKWGVVWA